MITSEDTNAKRDDTIVSDPESLGGMPVIKGTRVLAYDLAASVKAGIPRDRILAAYPTITEHHLDLAVAVRGLRCRDHQRPGRREFSRLSESVPAIDDSGSADAKHRGLLRA